MKFFLIFPAKVAENGRENLRMRRGLVSLRRDEIAVARGGGWWYHRGHEIESLLVGCRGDGGGVAGVLRGAVGV